MIKKTQLLNEDYNADEMSSTLAIYLNFTGAEGVTYVNSQLGVEVGNIDIAASGFTAAEILSVLTLLNASAPDVSFVAERPATGAYSTIHIGETAAFDHLGKVKAIAETTGRAAGQEAGDNAFVLLQNITSESELIQIIAHETGHLTGSVTHDYGKDGLTIDDFMVSDTAIVTPGGTANSVTIGTTTYAGDASASFEAAAAAGYNTIVMQNIDSARFDVDSGKILIADQIRMSGNTGSDYGGAIHNRGTLTISGSTFTNNSAINLGGAIYGGVMTISGSTFTGNTATVASGGAISGGVMTISGSTFTGNTATVASGGAISTNYNGTLNISGSSFSNNFAECFGGAIEHDSGTLTISDSTFSDNTSNTGGYFQGANWMMLNGGGAIYNRGTATITSSAFYANSSNETAAGLGLANGGGAIDNLGTMTIRGSNFSNNYAGNDGAAIMNGANATLEISGSTFTDNWADRDGAAIYNNYVNNGSTATTTISGSTFSGNTAYNEGGAIYNRGMLTVSGSTFRKNEAFGNGGAIYNTSFESNLSSITIEDCYFLTNLDTIVNANNAKMTFKGTVSLAGNLTSDTNITATSATVLLDISSYEDDGYAIIISNLAQIVEAAGFGITISENQAGGVYKLAGGARAFKGNITISNGKESGIFTYDNGTYNSLTFGGVDYFLNNFGGTLALEVRAVVLISATQTDSLVINGATYSGAWYSSLSAVSTPYSIIAMQNIDSWRIDLDLGKTLIADQIRINNNTNNIGGAINADNATLTISGSIFTGNSAEKDGGAIFSNGVMTISGSTFTGNSATTGGAIFSNGVMTISDSTFSGNSVTTGSGGAIFNRSTVTVSGSTFTGNSATAPVGTVGAIGATGNGGAIRNMSTLNISGSSFSDNFANCYGGAIINDGKLTVSGSIFSGNTSHTGGRAENGGGAIINFTTATITDSTFCNNFSAQTDPTPQGNLGGGGAINNSDTMNISGSSFSGNRANHNGGAISNGSNGHLEVSGSTFTDNRANNNGGAIFNNYVGSGHTGTATISGSTFTGNRAIYGAAICNRGTATVSGSTFSGNSATSGTGGAIYNTIAENESSSITIEDCYFLTASDTIGNAKNAKMTFKGTVSLAGNLTTESDITATGATVLMDISSYANGGNTVIISNIAQIVGAAGFGITISENQTAGFYTLAGGAEAFTGNITISNGKESGTFTYKNDTYSSVTLGGVDYFLTNINGTLTFEVRAVVLISATQTDSLVINGATYSGAWYDSLGAVSTPYSVIAMQNVNSAHIGLSDGKTLIADQIRMSGNSGSYDGGAIFGNNATLTISGSTFTNNSANNSGGAIFGSGTTLTVSGSTFSGNSANGGDYSSGGAIYGTGTMNISGSTFTNNSATSGGAIYGSGATLTISGSTFSGNSAFANGGAVYGTGTMNISGSSFSGNSAGYDGGAVYGDGTMNISGSTFSGNSASGNGGAIYNNVTGPNSTASTISDSTFIGNTANGSGGAIFNGGKLTVSGSSFSGNSAGNDGGAIMNEFDSTLTLSGSTFSGNSANRNGGAIYSNYVSSGSTVSTTISGSTFSGNTANDGGAIYNLGTTTVSGSTFSGNRAHNKGGAIYNTTAEGKSSSITIEDCYFLTADDTIFNTLNAQMTFTGTVSLAGNLTTESDITATGATVLMDISSYKGGSNTVIISNIAQIVGAAGFGITISEDQVPGKYTLAQGAKTFTGNITISNGKKSDTFTYSNGTYSSVTFDGLEYFLTNTDGTLTLQFGDVVLVSATQTDSLVINGATYSGPWYDSIGAVSTYYSVIAMQNVDSARFELALGKTLIADQIRMSGNSGSDDGGAINNQGKITISSSTFTNNSADSNTLSNGGAIRNTGTLKISGSTFTNNSASNSGGAIFGSGVMNISGSTFSGNTVTAPAAGAINSGGAIVSSGTLNISGSSFSNNFAKCYGGAIYNTGTLTVSGSTFSGNTSHTGGRVQNGGGAIYNTGTATITDSTFSNNLSAQNDIAENLGHGGGAIANNDTLTVSGSTFTGNTAGNDGAAIFGETGSTLTVSGSTFSGNSATRNGGAIYNNYNYVGSGKTGTDTISGSTFTGNTANNGAAIYNRGTATVSGSTFSGNRAHNKGGAIYNTTYEANPCAITIDNCYFLTESDTIFNTLNAKMTFTGTVSLAGNLTSNSDITATGATVLMDITSYKGSGNTVIISNIAQIVGAAKIGITISENQAFGKYTLAGGAAAFKGNISISNGKESDIFTYGTTGYDGLCMGNSIYNLTDVSGTLELTIKSATAIITASPTDSVVIGGVTYSGAWYGSDFAATDKLCSTIAMQNVDSTRIDLLPYKTTLFIADQIRMTGNSGAVEGGAIFGRGKITLSGSTFSKNSATSGGAIYTQNSTMTISGSTFTENSATSGGAIYNYYSSKLTINNSTFSKNSATIGGAIYNGNGEVTINGSTFTENTSSGPGAAIVNSDTLTINDSLFSKNSSFDNGGAITNLDTATINNSTFSGNSHGVDYKGGAIYNWNDFPSTRADITIRDSWFTTASDTIFNNGGIVRFEGTVSLAGNFSSTNSEIFAANATIVMDISSYSPGNTVEIISNMAQFQGAPEWAISVSLKQTAGTYTLARGAAEFKGNITIRCGNESGTFVYNNGVYSGNVIVGAGLYNLVNVDGTLTLTVESAIAIITATQTDSVVINGTRYTGAWFSNISDALNTTRPIVAAQNVDITHFDISGKKTVIADQIRMTGNNGATEGGAIYNGGTLTLSGSTFTGNSATQNGGAIYNFGTTTISGSTFTGNSAANGGAIYNGGTLTLSGSTFSGNTTTQDGGAIFNDSTATISGSTFSGNTATGNGGAIYNSGTVTIENSYFTTATDTIFNTGSMTFKGTVSLAGNLTSNNNITADGATILLDLSSYNSGNSTVIINNIAQIVGAAGYGITVAANQASGKYLLAGGAAEFTGTLKINGTTAITINGPGVTYNDYTYLLTQSGGNLTLTIGVVAALVTANSTDSIVIDGITYMGTWFNSITEAINNSSSIAVQGMNLTRFDLATSTTTLLADQVRMHGQYGGISNYGNLTFRSSTFTDNSGGQTGVIYNGGMLKVSGSTFTENRSSNDGGVIYNRAGGTVEITGSTFQNNTAISGGAIYNSNNATVSGSTFSGNSVTDNGGAISSNGSLTVSGSTFTSNTSDYWAGAIYNSPNRTLTVTGSTFSSNKATRRAGAIFNDGGVVTISGSTLSENSAADGGAIFNSNGTLAVIGSILQNNTANYGGAIYTYGTLTVSGSTFSGNSVTYDGGAIKNSRKVTINSATFTDDTGATTVRGSTFSGNKAARGGAIFNEGSTATVDMTGATFTGNSATTGGAIYNDSGSVTISGSTFSGNSATQGGAIYNSGTATIENSYFTTATDTIYNTGSMTFMGTVSVAGNLTSSNNITVDGATILLDLSSYNSGNTTVIIDNIAQIAGAAGYGITVSAKQASGKYLLAKGAAEFTGTLKINGTTEITVNGPGVIYNNYTYLLTQSGGNLTLNIGVAAALVTASYTNGITIDGETYVGSWFSSIDEAAKHSSFIAVQGIGISKFRLDPGKTLIADQVNMIGQSGSIFNGGNLTFNSSIFSNNTNNWSVMIVNGSMLTVNGSTFTDNHNTPSNSEGGAIFNYAQDRVDITGSTFQNNSAAKGGAICNHGMLTVDGSTFSRNVANKYGGAIYNDGTVTISGSTFTNNTTADEGGVIYNVNESGSYYENGAKVTIIGSTFNNNVAKRAGAIFSHATVTISGSTFSNNTASAYRAGAIYNSCKLTINSATFTDNTGATTVRDSTFSGNFAADDGGAIYNIDGRAILNVTGATFSSNTVGYKGGAIYNDNSATLDVTVFNNNVANDLGGAIYNTGSATISGSTFTGNSAKWGGAIYNEGSATINGSTFSNNKGSDRSGAFYNQGAATINNSIFSGNTADYGSAINSWGTTATVGVSNSTFSTNSAAGYGGALYNRDSTVTFEKSTFDGNTAQWGGAIYNYATGTVKIDGSTFNANIASGTSALGGAIYNEGSATINGSTFTGNTATGIGPLGGAIYNTGTATINGSTFTNNTASESGGAIFNTATVSINRSTVTDSTGVSTVSGASFNGNFGNNGGAIRNEQTGTLEVTGASFSNNKALAGGAIHNNGTATINDSTFSNNFASNSASAIYNARWASLHIDGSTFSENTSLDNGGAIYNSSGGQLTVKGSTFSKNVVVFNASTTYRCGGAIYADGGQITIDGSSFSENTSHAGGAIYATSSSSTVTITGSTFSGNYTRSTGGALEIHNNARAAITNSTFTGNYAVDRGGAINIYAGTTKITDSTFTGNYVKYNGGVIYNTQAHVIITGSTFGGNTTTKGFGGVIFSDSRLEVKGSTFTGNTATGGGGGVICNQRTTTISDSTFSDNVANNANGFGGAIYSANTNGSSPGMIIEGNLTITGSTFSGNIASALGGAIYNVNTASISGSTFSGNRVTNANGKGGAIYNMSTLTIENSVFTTASDSIYNDGGNLTFKGTVSLAGNLTSTNNITATGATIVMDISGYAPGNKVEIINNITQLASAAAWGITVSADQAHGEYLLAKGAVNFEKNITISNGTESTTLYSYGLAVLGNTLFIFNRYNDSKTLTIKSATAIITGSQTNSVVINGVTYTGDWHSEIRAVNVGCTTIAMQKVASERFFVYSNQTLIADQITISGHTTFNNDGMIDNRGVATITGSTFSNNTTNNGKSGAIYNQATATISGSTFTGNKGDGGGAIYNIGTATISGSTFSGNTTTTGEGGAIFNQGTLTLENSSFLTVSDIITNDGGNLTFKGTVSLAGFLYSSNDITATGATILMDISSHTSSNTTVIITNMARIQEAAGYGITVSAKQASGTYTLARGAAVDISFSISDGTYRDTFTYNGKGYNTVIFGTTIYTLANTGGDLTLTVEQNTVALITETATNSVTIVNGTAATTYTGEWFADIGAVSAELTTIVMQKVASDRFDLAFGKTLVADQINISGKTTTGNGGAIFNSGNATISGSTFTGNKATEGGAIFNEVGSSLTIENSSFLTVSDTIYNNGGSLTLKGTVSLAGKLTSTNHITATGATIVIDISSYEGYNSDAIINNMALIQEAAGYGITVSANQLPGSYLLASGAGVFTGNITISNGTTNGLFTYNKGTYNEVAFGDYIYMLNNRDGELCLDMIEGIANPWYTPGSGAPTKLEVIADNASGDFDGNGNGALTENHTYSGTFYGGGDVVPTTDIYSAVRNVNNSALTVVGGHNGTSIVPVHNANVWLDIFGSTLGMVYGGSANADINGDINLNMTDSTVNYLYGNAVGAANNVIMNILGVSNVNNEIQGGVLNANLNGDSTINITGGSTGNGVTLGNGKNDFLLFAGLKVAASGANARSFIQSGKSTLNIANATLSARSYLFGGGYAMAYGTGEMSATVSGGAMLTIDNVTVAGNSVIYGGGRAYGKATSVVAGGVKVALSNLTLNAETVLTVYGGGLADSIGSATVTGGVHISVNGQMTGDGKLNIFGGGRRAGATVDSVLIEIGSPDAATQKIAIGNLYAGGKEGATVTGTGTIRFMGSGIRVSGMVSGDNGSATRTVVGDRTLAFDRSVTTFEATAQLANFEVVSFDSKSRVTFTRAPNLSTVSRFAWTVVQSDIGADDSVITFAGTPTWKSDLDFTLNINDIGQSGTYTFMIGENLSDLIGKNVTFTIGGTDSVTLTSTIGGPAASWNDWDITFALDESNQKLNLAFAQNTPARSADSGYNDISQMVNALALDRLSSTMSETLTENSTDWNKKNNGMLA